MRLLLVSLVIVLVATSPVSAFQEEPQEKPQIEVLSNSFSLARISENFVISQGFWPCGPYIVGDSTVVGGVAQERLVFMVINQETRGGILSFWLRSRTEVVEDSTARAPKAHLGRLGRDTIAVITVSPEQYEAHAVCLGSPEPERR